MTTSLTIQQAAAKTGLSVHTLRYYEKIGLLDPIARQDNTHRLFREEDLLWIGFLLKLRSTGLPIRDMLRYAELRRAGNTAESVSARKALLQQHARTVEETIAELQSNLAVLHMKVNMYEEMEAALPAVVVTQPQEPEDASNEQRNNDSNDSNDSNKRTHKTSDAGRHPQARR
ncbi:MerR family transcriptional regulator [Herbaspirillum rhizosphaerae]|uniref:MerR family transcriptional regulator n=1 Tax=Herbaspirillum rhizosphaerae TaxID=346179 RepID=A0ABW8Z4L3_9BURK